MRQCSGMSPDGALPCGPARATDVLTPRQAAPTSKTTR
jgi:hypothetical protein